MVKRTSFIVVIASILSSVANPACGQIVEHVPGTVEERAIAGHVSQADITSGIWTVRKLREAGRRLFLARFTTLDGACRPGSLGSADPAVRSEDGFLDFMRAGGPDANSCASCHNSPNVGGAGDFTTNVFVGLGESRFPRFSTAASFSNERGTPDLHGLGIVEVLAREISVALQTIRDDAIETSRQMNQPCRRTLVTKGIDFGAITATADGELDFSELDGIDHDLIVRPFGQKGSVASIREFTINAANLHHGMQATERFGTAQTNTDDFDKDGIVDELTEGDITALTVFQATMNMPGQVLPSDQARRDSVSRGEQLFRQVKCAVCHIPELPIDNSVLLEPGPYNFRGTLSQRDLPQQLATDLEAAGPAPHLSRDADGRLVARVFTDFKRHIIADNDRPHWANETVVERRLPGNMFLTRRLWATGSTAPYGHRGDITTVREAIDHHGGDATESRKLFDQLAASEKSAIIQFLKSLRILPEGSARVVVESPLEKLPYTRVSLD